MPKQAFNILIFDSGVGGLSIYHALKNASFNTELTQPNQYIYFADHQAAPYGDKEDLWLNSRIHTLLTSLNKTHSPDLIIIACNTASTLSLDSLRQSISTPIIGVVPAIKTAALLANEHAEKHIGLLATPATIQRQYIKDLTEQFAQDLTLQSIGSTELVTQAENKLSNGRVDLDVLSSVIQPFLDNQCRHVVLGCTHFPLLRVELEQIAPDVHWIDSGQAIAKRAAQIKNSVLATSLQSLASEKADKPAQFISSYQIAKGLEQYLTDEGFKLITENFDLSAD